MSAEEMRDDVDWKHETNVCSERLRHAFHELAREMEALDTGKVSELYSSGYRYEFNLHGLGLSLATSLLLTHEEMVDLLRDDRVQYVLNRHQRRQTKR